MFFAIFSIILHYFLGPNFGLATVGLATRPPTCSHELLDPTLAMLNIEPPESKNSGSNVDDPINLAHLLGMLHIVDLIC
jgi:hypothetical protein